jgi:hypothetical protein
MRYFRHDKTGNIYILLHIAEECTNGSEGIQIAVYRYKEEDNGKVYTRRLSEFYEKFTEV